MGAIISLKSGVAGDIRRRFGAPVDFELLAGEHIAVVGPNGSGKTTLVQTFAGRLFLRSGSLDFDFQGCSGSVSDNIRYVTFNDAYGTGDYYQQRWNSADRDSLPSVWEQFGGVMPEGGVFESLGLNDMWHKRIVMLSTGEMRKLCIARMLLGKPRVLIIDNPFIGLDAGSRKMFAELLDDLSRRGDLNIVIVVTDAEDIPPFITHVYAVDGMICSAKSTRENYLSSVAGIPNRDYFPKLPYCASDGRVDRRIVEMHDVTVRYGNHVILDRFNWTVLRDEKWSVCGDNGSGKSTLLSLICADNPQGYSQDMSLFGRRRGTGESIWDIKRHIGYVSAEMHRSYMRNMPAVEIVASGFFDTIGLYRRPSEEQIRQSEAWLGLFEVGHLRDRSFVRLSFGQQRLLLLIRAMVKNPDLLILDEPMHGLDNENKRLAKAVIEEFAVQPDKTLIYVTHFPQELPACINKFLYLRKIEKSR